LSTDRRSAEARSTVNDMSTELDAKIEYWEQKLEDAEYQPLAVFLYIAKQLEYYRELKRSMGRRSEHDEYE